MAQQSIFITYLWEPWVRFLSWLNPQITSSLAFQATSAMVVVAAIVYIILEYHIIKRLSGGSSEWGGGEKVTKSLSVVMTIAIVMFMAYSPVIVFIVGIMQLFSVIAVLGFLIITLFVLYGFGKKYAAIGSELSSEAGKEFAEHVKTKAESYKTLSDASKVFKDTFAKNKIDRRERKATRQMNKYLKEIENEKMDLIETLEALEQYLPTLLQQVKEGGAPHDRNFAARLAPIVAKFEDTEHIMQQQFRNVVHPLETQIEGGIHKSETFKEDAERIFKKLKKDISREIKGFEREKKEFRKIHKDIIKLPTHNKNQRTLLAKANMLENEIGKIENELENLEHYEQRIMNEFRRLESQADTYEDAEIQELERFDTQETKLIAQEVKSAKEFSAAMSKMIDTLNSESSVSQKQNSIKRVLSLIPKMTKLFQTDFGVTKQFERRQEAFENFLTRENLNENKESQEIQALINALNNINTQMSNIVPQLKKFQEEVKKVGGAGGGQEPIRNGHVVPLGSGVYLKGLGKIDMKCPIDGCGLTIKAKAKKHTCRQGFKWKITEDHMERIK